MTERTYTADEVDAMIARAVAAAKQEFVCSTGLCHYNAQRQWVGLTHDEYDAICDKNSAMSDFDFLADIEAKLREKNQ